MPLRLAFLAALSGPIAGPIAVSSARADMLVLESTVPQYKVGDHLADNVAVEVGDGQHVKVLLLPSNTTKVFEGKGGNVGALPFGGMRGIKRRPPPPQ
jgi:hypothetical protein